MSTEEERKAVAHELVRGRRRVRARNPVWRGEGRPNDEQIAQFAKEIAEMNKELLEALG